jgi:hypothetical protein
MAISGNLSKHYNLLKIRRSWQSRINLSGKLFQCLTINNYFPRLIQLIFFKHKNQISMLDQLFNIVKNFGQETVVNNPDVPNEYNQEVMADATHTIAGGFKNMVAGGGLENILDLFKGGGGSNTGGGGIAGLMKNPIVSMMIGHFMSKLVGKYSMSPSIASNVANTIIPKSLNGLIEQTRDPNNKNLNLDGFINSIIGGGDPEAQPAQTSGGGPLQNLIEKFTGGGEGGGNSNSGGGGGFNIQDLIGKFTQKSQNNLAGGQGGGGLMDMIKGFFN